MKTKRDEKKIIILAILITSLIILALTMSQGSIKKDEDRYVSPKNINDMNQYKVDDEEYKIIKVDNQQYEILCKRELNTKEIAYLTKKLIEKDEKMKDGYELNLFIEENSNKNQIKVVPVNNNAIKIQNIKELKEIQEGQVPTNFKVLNIQDIEGITEVEVIIESIKTEKDALSQLIMFGDVLKNQNKDKNIENLNIIAYTSNEKKASFEYNTEDEYIIKSNSYEKLR